jgi:transmembrane sensor
LRLEAAPGDKALRAEFEKWLAQSDSHRTAYAAVAPVWQDSARLPPLTDARREAAREKTRRRWVRDHRFALAITAVAACLAVLAFPALQIRMAADYMTATAELRDVVLEDGSRVSLDAGSAVAVDYSKARRTVSLLAGQVFFEVTPSADRPFIVTAGPVAVTVTGTAFAVGTSESGVDVAVQSGTVMVTRNGTEKLASLGRGRRLKIASSGRLTETGVVPEDVAAWRSRRLVVYDAPVREVVEEIGRHVEGIIVFGDSDIADSLVSGIIDLQKPSDALRALVDLKKGRVTAISPYFTVISSR